MTAVVIAGMLFSIVVSGEMASGKKVATKLKAPKRTVVVKEPKGIEITEHTRDTLLRDSIMRNVTLRGYEKNGASKIESFFIVNNTQWPLIQVDIEIDYRTMDGRQLHFREETIKKLIPAGETRKIDIKSWDLQGSFYYHKSSAPRSGGMPYEISMRIKRLLLPQKHSKKE